MISLRNIPEFKNWRLRTWAQFLSMTSGFIRYFLLLKCSSICLSVLFISSSFVPGPWLEINRNIFVIRNIRPPKNKMIKTKGSQLIKNESMYLELNSSAILSTLRVLNKNKSFCWLGVNLDASVLEPFWKVINFASNSGRRPKGKCKSRRSGNLRVGFWKMVLYGDLEGSEPA